MSHIPAVVLALALVSACGVMHTAEKPAGTPAIQASANVESKDVTRLNALTRTLIDASKLYGEAAGLAKVPAYQAQLRRLAAERRAMVPKFQARVRALGGAPDSEGGALGAGHMAFMEARSLVQDDTRTAVAEVLRGEKYIVDEITATSQDPDVSDATHRFAAAQLPGLERDRNRVQRYLDTIEGK